MKKVIIKTKEKSYSVIISSGSLQNFSSDWALKIGDTAVLITDNRVASIYLSKLHSMLNSYGIVTDQFVFESGEENKSLNVLNAIFDKLLAHNYDRDTILIALGGGVVGDLTGFAAATYQRGIRFIQIPTTLLAQVDASIGGKTGINHKFGKNMIGAFYQPSAVIIDLNCLSTLNSKEFSSGLAEVIKYAVLFDSDFFIWLENNLNYLLNLDQEALMYCVYHCCKLKASIIASDTYEKGIRSLLNLGHTYGHAIESYLGYGKWSHGEAISAGIMMAINASLHLGEFINMKDAIRVKLLLQRAKLPILGPIGMQTEDYIEYMIRDKKSRLGKISLILPVSIGKSKVMSVNQDLILNSIEKKLIE